MFLVVCLDVDPDDKVNLSSKEGADEVEKQQDVVKEEVRQAPPPVSPVTISDIGSGTDEAKNLLSLDLWQWKRRS